MPPRSDTVPACSGSTGSGSTSILNARPALVTSEHPAAGGGVHDGAYRVVLDPAAAAAPLGGLLGLGRGPGDQPGRGEDHLARVVGDLQRPGRRGRGQHLLEVAVDQGGAARGAELLDDGGQLVGDDLLEHLLVVEDPGQLGDLAAQPLLLGLQLDPVVLGQPAQRGVQDVGGLDVGEPELAASGRPWRPARRRCPGSAGPPGRCRAARSAGRRPGAAAPGACGAGTRCAGSPPRSGAPGTPPAAP